MDYVETLFCNNNTLLHCRKIRAQLKFCHNMQKYVMQVREESTILEHFSYYLFL